MTFESDSLIDRRRLKRQLGVWRIVALVAIVAGVLVAIEGFDGVFERNHVARVRIEGIILGEPEIIDLLGELADDTRVKAVLLHIDSPGGTFVGGESLYAAIREISERKPVAAVMGTVAASAGYMVAIAADRIVARQGTVTGSIGVIMQTTDITGLLEKIGVSAEAIKSGPLKAVPSPLEPLTDEARAATQAIIDDMHAVFTGLVAERRGLDVAAARRLADGRIYSGRQARELDLIDAIGGEAEARAWLSEERGIPARLPTYEVSPLSPAEEWFGEARSLFGKVLHSERLTLDGLVSVWHPGGE